MRMRKHTMLKVPLVARVLQTTSRDLQTNTPCTHTVCIQMARKRSTIFSEFQQPKVSHPRWGALPQTASVINALMYLVTVADEFASCPSRDLSTAIAILLATSDEGSPRPYNTKGKDSRLSSQFPDTVYVPAPASCLRNAFFSSAGGDSPDDYWYPG